MEFEFKHTSEDDAMNNWKSQLATLDAEYEQEKKELPENLEVELVNRIKAKAASLATSAVSAAAFKHPFTSSAVQPALNKVARPLVISRQHGSFIANIARVLHQHTSALNTAIQATEISIVDQSDLTIKDHSTENYVRQCLMDHPEGLHINDIIELIEAAGCSSKSKYHRYNRVEKILRSHYYMFTKSSGVYKLRAAFRNHTLPERVGQYHKKNGSIPTLSSIVADAITAGYVYPNAVYEALQAAGYRDVSRREVHRVMQNRTLFSRDGFTYGIQSTKPSDANNATEEDVCPAHS